MKKVVSATLAGALAVGMVPAMALADDAIELQAVTDKATVQQSTVSAYAGGVTVDTQVAFDDDEAFAKIVPIAAAIGGAGEGELDVVAYQWAKYLPASTATPNSGNYVINGKPFVMNGSWSSSNAGIPADAGNYVMRAAVAYDEDKDGTVEAGEFEWSYNCVTFTVLPEELSEDIVIYEKAGSNLAKGIIDTEIVYNGVPFGFGNNTLGLAIDGKDAGSANVVGLFDANTNLQLTTAAELAAAGEYYALCQFDDAFVKVPYTIAKFNVEKAKVELDKTILVKGTDTSVAIDEIYDVTFAGSELAKYVQIEKVSTNLTAPELGPIEVTVGLTAAGKTNPNIEGVSQTLDAIVVESDISDSLSFVYTDVAALQKYVADGAETDGSFDVDVTVNRTDKVYSEFDATKLAVTVGTTAITDYTLVVTKHNALTGKWDEAKVEDITNKAAYGVYNIKAVLNAAPSYKVAGETKELTVEVINGEIKNADVAYAYKGDNVTTYEYDDENGGTAIVYNGANFMDDLKVVVKANGVVVPEADYSVVVKKYNAKSTATDKWEVVTDGIVNMGDYKIEVASTKYVVKANAIYVDIAPVAPKTEYADQVDKTTGCQLLYTGKAVNPIAGFTVADGPDADKDRDAVDVPASAYKLTITEFTPEGETTPVLKKDVPTDFVAPGKYVYTIEDADAADNYSITKESKAVRITSQNVYPDVPVDAWYADEVLEVAQLGWITGYDNGLFGPNDNMKRGDLALVLGRALDMNVNPLLDGSTNTIIKVVTGFEDVDGGAYYARAIKAVSEAGIMTGYADGSYGPNDPVTRQMLVTILARLEASGLGDASILASALDAYADADEVAGWAAPGMEWAVENGIIGVDTAFLNPTDPATRAEVAAMLLRYNAEFGGLKPVAQG